MIKKRTARGTWQAAERRSADYHNPGFGKRNPLSGGLSGITRADARQVPGLFIESKYRARCAAWTTYLKTMELSKSELLVPVVSFFLKGKKGFLDIIHTDYIDRYIQTMIKNRAIEVDPPDSIIFGTLDLPFIYRGTQKQLDTLLMHLRGSSFNGDGTLKEEWWIPSIIMKDDRLDPWTIIPVGFERVLYGHFSHKFKKGVKPIITAEDFMALRGVTK